MSIRALLLVVVGVALSSGCARNHYIPESIKTTPRQQLAEVWRTMSGIGWGGTTNKQLYIDRQFVKTNLEDKIYLLPGEHSFIYTHSKGNRPDEPIGGHLVRTFPQLPPLRTMLKRAGVFPEDGSKDIIPAYIDMSTLVTGMPRADDLVIETFVDLEAGQSYDMLVICPGYW